MRSFRKNVKKISSFLTLAILIFATSFSSFIPSAYAANVTSFSDTLTTLTDGASANHEIKFVTPGGLTDTQTITLTFVGFTGIASITEDDVDFATGSTNNCTSATFTEQATASTPSGATYGVATALQVLTITSGTGDVTADRCVRVRIGTNAVSSGTGANQIANAGQATAHSVAVNVNSGTDIGTAAIDIITDDSVTVTASVDPTISFSISDTTIGFGSLSLTTGRWATGDTFGEDASEILPTAAHTMSIATNAASGYTVTYLGPTLTSGANTLAGSTTIAGGGDSDGTPGTEQFGLAVSVSGDASIAGAYTRTATTKWRFIANTLNGIVQETVPTDTETISVSYLANIAPTTPAGSYATDVTYIATGNF